MRHNSTTNQILRTVHNNPNRTSHEDLYRTYPDVSRHSIRTAIRRLEKRGHVEVCRVDGRIIDYVATGTNPYADTSQPELAPKPKPVIDLGPITKVPFDPETVRNNQLNVELALYGERI